MRSYHHASPGEISRHFREAAHGCLKHSRCSSLLASSLPSSPRLVEFLSTLSFSGTPCFLFFAAISMVSYATTGSYRTIFNSTQTNAPDINLLDYITRLVSRHSEEIREIVSTHRVQTTDPNRAAALYIGLQCAQRFFRAQDLYLVDLGCGAGILLYFDRFRYQFLTPDTSLKYRINACVGPPKSPVTVKCSVPRLSPWLQHQSSPPGLVGRIGVDLRSIEIHKPAIRSWLQALLREAPAHSRNRLDAALLIASTREHEIIEGDVTEGLLYEVVSSLPPDCQPCLFHSHLLLQLSPEGRERLSAQYHQLSRERPLIVIGLEWESADVVLRIQSWKSGRCARNFRVARSVPGAEFMYLEEQMKCC